MNKYQREITGEAGFSEDGTLLRFTVDVYDVLDAFGVTCHATAHAIKKLLMAGKRGHKDAKTDLAEAIIAIERAIEQLPPEVPE